MHEFVSLVPEAVVAGVASDGVNESIGDSEVERNAQFVLYNHIVEVKELEGYSHYPDIRPQFGEKLALYHPVTSEFITLDSDAWKIFEAAKNGSATPKDISFSTGIDLSQVEHTVDALKEKWIFLPKDQRVKVVIEPRYNEELEVYLEISEACNFRCPGCAVGAERYKPGEAQTMDMETIELILRRAVHSGYDKGAKEIKLKIAGGEPLMPKSFRLIEEAQDIIASLQEQYPSIKISQVVLTNGAYLSEEVVERLKELGVNVSVSLWGIGEANDRARLPVNKTGMYSNIARGIERLHETGVNFNINHVLTPQNAANFADFISAMWDTKSDNYIGKSWNWEGEQRKPIPVGINFFRPQTPQQLEMLKNGGYDKMIRGLRNGFDVIRNLIKKGTPIQPLDRIDYLQLSGVIPSPCGSGFNYIAAGPRGVASCHEALFNMQPNLDLIREENINLINLANSEYDGEQRFLIGPNINFGSLDPTTSLILSLHGGSGCPRTIKLENEGNLGAAASTAEMLYAPILDELLSLETMRRLLQ